jgi:hypothetical protein
MKAEVTKRFKLKFLQAMEEYDAGNPLKDFLDQDDIDFALYMLMDYIHQEEVDLEVERLRTIIAEVDGIPKKRIKVSNGISQGTNIQWEKIK